MGTNGKSCNARQMYKMELRSRKSEVTELRKLDHQGSRAYLSARTHVPGRTCIPKNCTELKAKETIRECKYSKAPSLQLNRNFACFFKITFFTSDDYADLNLDASGRKDLAVFSAWPSVRDVPSSIPRVCPQIPLSTSFLSV